MGDKGYDTTSGAVNSSVESRCAKKNPLLIFLNAYFFNKTRKSEKRKQQHSFRSFSSELSNKFLLKLAIFHSLLYHYSSTRNILRFIFTLKCTFEHLFSITRTLATRIRIKRQINSTISRSIVLSFFVFTLKCILFEYNLKIRKQRRKFILWTYEYHIF